jgi:hypothetical protein
MLGHVPILESTLTHLQMGKNTLQWTILEVTMIVFLSESKIIALYLNLFEKFGKSEMKK